MAPATSDNSRGRDAPGEGTERSSGSTGSGDFRVERREIQGEEVLVRLVPDEVYVEWRTNRPAYYRIGVGDRIKDADADVTSPRIAEWTVVEITPERVVGESVKEGDRREWDRETLERGLVVGNFATSLGDFARVSVYPVGDWETFDAAADPSSRVYRGRPYLTIVAYGDNGQKYGLRYRYVEEGNDTDVTLWEEDVSVSALDDDIRRRLFEHVEGALSTDEYVVVTDSGA